ncbi:hypothetical protein C8J55DRAFT_392281, partial [Lentinula edodes]
ESCEYEADKQRLKRHIENTHLKISTHDTPFKCPFDGCNVSYNDSARLHRHK